MFLLNLRVLVLASFDERLFQLVQRAIFLSDSPNHQKQRVAA